ncbi:MAG: ABC transporter ATP-binding protein, partial [Actinomycetales bacterium]|nr:ABC transporter ATP-binding protein [Actinomycetales bacterium]
GWTCLVGPNGAGKTTLLRVLVGAQPFHGEVRVAGRALDSRGWATSSCAFVSQRPAAPAGMRVEEYIALGRFPSRDRRPGSDRALLDGTLDALHLTSMRNRLLTSLSGGELQRCAIGRALAQRAPVLLLDEPTSALDLHRQPEILDIIDRQRHEHGTTIVSTMHDITLAAMYAKDFVVMDHGRVVDAGATHEVCGREALARAFNHNIEVVPGPGGTPVVLPKRR